jgi:hypothetical protein
MSTDVVVATGSLLGGLSFFLHLWKFYKSRTRWLFEENFKRASTFVPHEDSVSFLINVFMTNKSSSPNTIKDVLIEFEHAKVRHQASADNFEPVRIEPNDAAPREIEFEIKNLSMNQYDPSKAKTLRELYGKYQPVVKLIFVDSHNKNHKFSIPVVHSKFKQVEKNLREGIY